MKTSLSLNGNSVSRRPNLVLLGSVLVTLVALLLWPMQKPGMFGPNTKVSQASAMTVEAPTCQQALDEPKKVVADWNAGQTSQVKVQSKDEIFFGGVRSNILTLTCDDLYAEYRVTFVRVKDIWQLKNLVQLEN